MSTRAPRHYKVMYEFWCDAMRTQKPHIRKAWRAAAGDDFGGWMRALQNELVVVSVQLCDDGLWYTASLRVSDGLAPVTRVHANRLGLGNEETLRNELGFAHMQLLAEQPAPHDLSQLDADA